MERKSRIFLLTGLVFIVLVACSREAQYIETVAPSDNPYLVQVDSFEGDFVIVREDSFVTSTSAFALSGYHRDDVFGSVRCEHFVRIGLPSIPEIPNSARFDSIELVLKLNDAWYGDTLQPFVLHVHRLNSALSNEKNVFYNTTSFATGQALGAVSQRIRPRADDSLRVVLANDFGNELFSLIRNKSVVFDSEEKFLEYFKGLRLSVDTTITDLVTGFSKDLIMRLHYHEDDGNIQKKTIEFKPSSSPYQFNYIYRRFNDASLAPLESGKEVNASRLGDRFYLQEFAGIRTRIDFPNLAQVLKASDYVKVLNAQLEIRPVNSSYLFYPLPPVLHLYQRQSDQSLYGPIVYSDGTTQNGSLSVDNLYGKDTRYLFDVTNFVLQELAADDYSSQQLVLAIGGDSSLNRLSANTTASSEYRTRLIVSMLVYKTN